MRTSGWFLTAGTAGRRGGWKLQNCRSASFTVASGGRATRHRAGCAGGDPRANLLGLARGGQFHRQVFGELVRRHLAFDDALIDQALFRFTGHQAGAALAALQAAGDGAHVESAFAVGGTVTEDAANLKDGADLVFRNRDRRFRRQAFVDPDSDPVDFGVGQFDVSRRHLARDDLGEQQAFSGIAGQHRGSGGAAIEDGLLRAQVEFALRRRAMTHHAFGREDRLDIRFEGGRSGGGKGDTQREPGHRERERTRNQHRRTFRYFIA